MEEVRTSSNVRRRVWPYDYMNGSVDDQYDQAVVNELRSHFEFVKYQLGGDDGQGVGR